MSYQKTLVQGANGSIEVSESAGTVKIAATASADLGGGNVKGFVKASSQNAIEIPAVHLMDVGLDLLAAKFPSFATEIKLIEAALDAEIAKL